MQLSCSTVFCTPIPTGRLANEDRQSTYTHKISLRLIFPKCFLSMLAYLSQLPGPKTLWGIIMQLFKIISESHHSLLSLMCSQASLCQFPGSSLLLWLLSYHSLPVFPYNFATFFSASFLISSFFSIPYLLLLLSSHWSHQSMVFEKSHPHSSFYNCLNANDPQTYVHTLS